ELLSNRLEQLLKDQLEEKLLPSIDERFREMNELLVKFAGQMDTWARKDTLQTKSSIISNSNSASEGLVEHQDKLISNIQQKDKLEIEIAEYLINKNLSIVDKRDNGGALWIIGGWE